jgi:hypothetical protein
MTSCVARLVRASVAVPAADCDGLPVADIGIAGGSLNTRGR